MSNRLKIKSFSYQLLSRTELKAYENNIKKTYNVFRNQSCIYELKKLLKFLIYTFFLNNAYCQ